MSHRTRPTTRRPHRGATLLLAILVLLVMTIAGIALMFNSSTENALAGNETRMSKAFYAADSGIQYAVQRLTSDINFVGGPIPGGGLPSNTPGSTGNDIQVEIARPLFFDYLNTELEELTPGTGSYGTPPLVTVIYSIEATASSDEIRASKVVTAQVHIYPQELRLFE